MHIRSSWLEAFSFARAVIFISFSSCFVSHADRDCLSSTEYWILLIWSCIYFLWFFRYALVSSLCAFLGFWALALVGFLLLYRDVVFTSSFFLTTDVSQRVWLAIILLPLLYGHWRSSHILHSESVFLISPEIHRIYFLVLSYIYC